MVRQGSVWRDGRSYLHGRDAHFAESAACVCGAQSLVVLMRSRLSQPAYVRYGAMTWSADRLAITIIPPLLPSSIRQRHTD